MKTLFGVRQLKLELLKIGAGVLIIAALILILSGCSARRSVKAQEAAATREAMLRQLGENNIEKRVTNDELWNVFQVLLDIRAPDLSDNMLRDRFRRLKKYKTVEKPEFWVAIVNDPKYRSFIRRECLFEMVRRHFNSGTKLSKFGMVAGMEGWFTEETVINQTARGGGDDPDFWESPRHKSIITYRPEFLSKDAGLSFGLSQGTYLQDVLKIMNGQMAGKSVRITGIYTFEPETWTP